MGGGDVVQAMSPKLGVGVANLNGGYWAQHYYGGIRPARSTDIAETSGVTRVLRW